METVCGIKLPSLSNQKHVRFLHDALDMLLTFFKGFECDCRGLLPWLPFAFSLLGAHETTCESVSSFYSVNFNSGLWLP